MNKIWHKFFLLAVLSFMPMLSQAQFCTNGGIITKGAPETTPYPGGWKVVVKFSMDLIVPACNVTLRQLSGTSPGAPDNYSQHGVSVKIREAKIRLGNSLTCNISGNRSSTLSFFNCSKFPVPADVFVEYTLTGKSTTTDPNIELFPANLDAVTSGTNNWTGSQPHSIKVPASTAPTCSFLIDPPNITLEPIKNTDIENVAVGTAINTAQKNINLTVNCAANALSTSATFAPQFTPTKSAVLTGNSSVALNDGTDNGVGFKLFDSSGTALELNTPLVSTTNTLFSFTSTLQTVTKPFTLKYAKTSQAVKAGPVTSSITITFSIL